MELGSSSRQNRCNQTQKVSGIAEEPLHVHQNQLTGLQIILYKSYNKTWALNFALEKEKEKKKELTLIIHAPENATITATKLTVSWNCKNLEILS